jgi:hypothetical protein
MKRTPKSYLTLNEAVAAIIEEETGPIEPGMPKPIVRPLDDYVELKTGGYTTRALAREMGLALADQEPNSVLDPKG